MNKICYYIQLTIVPQERLQLKNTSSFNRDLSREFGIPISSFSPSVREIHFQKKFSDRAAFIIPSNISDRAPLQKQPTALTLISCCQAFSYSNWHLSSFSSVPCFPFFLCKRIFLFFRLSDILYICQYLFLETRKQLSGGVLQKKCSYRAQLLEISL